MPGSARRGGRYPGLAHDGSVAASRRLRCDARPARAVAVPPSAALNAPRTSRRPHRSGACGAGLPLAVLRFSPPHKSPTPGTAHRAETRSLSSATRATVVPAKARAGVRRQRHCAALRSTGLVAARAQRALRPLTRGDCSSVANEVSVASFAAGHETEHRKGASPQGWPPCTSAGAYPPAALHAQRTQARAKLRSLIDELA